MKIFSQGCFDLETKCFAEPKYSRCQACLNMKGNCEGHLRKKIVAIDEPLSHFSFFNKHCKINLLSLLSSLCWKELLFIRSNENEM